MMSVYQDVFFEERVLPDPLILRGIVENVYAFQSEDYNKNVAIYGRSLISSDVVSTAFTQWQYISFLSSNYCCISSDSFCLVLLFT